jgi:hypothetical protein
MTPLIGFRTDKTTESQGTIAAIRSAAGLTDATAPRTTTISDYAYRIAALTAGIALLASIW